MSFFRYVIFPFFVLCLMGCKEQEREPEAVLMKALEALNEEDYDTYLQRVDFGAEMDSAQTAYMKAALRQHLGWRRAERPAVTSIDMLYGKMQGDSICIVYYQYTFADNTKEVGAQKMVLHGENWKIRLRN